MFQQKIITFTSLFLTSSYFPSTFFLQVNNTLCTLEDFPCLAPEWKGNGTQCDLYRKSTCSDKPKALKKGALSGWKSVGGVKWGATTEKDLMVSTTSII